MISRDVPERLRVVTGAVSFVTVVVRVTGEHTGNPEHSLFSRLVSDILRACFQLSNGLPLLNVTGSEQLPFTKENLTLYPLYTFERPEGEWLLFEPKPSDIVEEFHVDVSTCNNVTIEYMETLYNEVEGIVTLSTVHT